MTLVPVGKTRVMVAQTISSPLAEGFEGGLMSSEPSEPSEPSIRPDFQTEEALDEDVTDGQEGMDGTNGVANNGIDDTAVPQEKTLTNYVFKKLTSYGYPGRRLQEFKSKFVRETVSPEGIKDIQIEIPDKKYPGADGVANTIENEDLKEIANEINEAFALNFNGADRSDGKWTIKFTSEKLNDPDEANVIHDNLDEVYGKPSVSKQRDSRGKRVAGNTFRELIKESKDEFIKIFTKAKGD